MEKVKKVKPNWLDPNTTAENEKLPKWFSLAWTSRGTAATLNILLIGYVTYYMTDAIGIPAGLAGMLILLTKVFDGVTDLVVGFIVDKTHTKLGKARPYELFIVLSWILTVMMYSVPTSMSMTGKAIYIFIMYSLINAVCHTFLGGIDAVYLSRAVRSEKNRVSVMSIAGAIGMVFTIGFSIVLPSVIDSIGTSSAGWSQLAISFAIPLSIIGVLRFIFVKEVVVDEPRTELSKENEPGVKEMLAAIVKNKYILIFGGMMFCAFLINGLGAAGTYYFKYIVGDLSKQSIATMGSVVMPLLFVFFPLIIKKFGTAGFLRGGAALGVVGILLRIVGGTNMITLTIGCTAGVIAVMPITAMMNLYIIECMDYGEWKTGIRVEGLLNSICNFMSKIGSGLAAGMTGIIMGMAGYDGAAAVQTPAANTAIIFLFNWIQLILFAAILILGLKFNLSKKMPQIQADLQERKNNKTIN